MFPNFNPNDPNSIMGFFSNDTNRQAAKSYWENIAFPYAKMRQDWAVNMMNMQNYRDQLGMNWQQQKWSQGMSAKEFAEKLRLAQVAEQQWRQTFARQGTQFNKTFGLQQTQANRDWRMQNMKYGLENRTANRNWKETVWQRGLSNRKLEQEKQLTQEGYRSNELQSRYQAFGRAQAPGQSWAKNW